MHPLASQRSVTVAPSMGSEVPPADQASRPPEASLAELALQVEDFALSALKQQDFSEGTCVHVLRRAFLGSVPNRRKGVLGDHVHAPYFCVGFFCKESRSGLSSHCARIPNTVRYLNAWMLSLAPRGTWTAIAVSANIPTEVHCDSKNEPSLANWCISLGQEWGGGLWVEDESGDVCRTIAGFKHDSHLRPVSFLPTLRHASTPWSGFRWVLTGYSPLGSLDLSADARKDLLALGFPLPTASVHNPCSPLPPKPASKVSRVVFMPSEPPDMPDASLAARLLAARPVTWRGTGELLQVPWGSACKGPWLVLDLWAGYSGLCISLLSIGLHFYAIAAERDPVARQCAANCMPSIVHTSEVEHISADILLPIIKKRPIRGVIVGGGSPCQPNSALNSYRQGLRDDRAHQPRLLKQLIESLRGHPDLRHLEIIAFLENVASAPSDVVGAYTSWLGGRPVLIEASHCGWTARKRLYWLTGVPNRLTLRLRLRLLIGSGVIPIPCMLGNFVTWGASLSHLVFTSSRASVL